MDQKIKPFLFFIIFSTLLSGCHGGERENTKLDVPHRPIIQPPEPASQFEQAMKNKKQLSTTELREFFKEPDSINKRDSNTNHTPLMAAAYYNQLDIVKYLVQNGARVNDVHQNPEQSVYGYPALMHAVINENAEMTEVLLNAGADMRLGPPKNVLSFVHFAAAGGQDDVLEKFLKKDPTIANWNLSIGTPLHQAANAQRITTIKLLLRYGADKSLLDREGNKPWRFADVNTRKAVPELEDK
jgi:ankyrin repeat protein